VTEISARFVKIFDPGRRCCAGIWINVQKFKAHSHLRFHHTDHCEHSCFLAFMRERSADPGTDRRVRRAHIKHPLRERSEVTPLTRLPNCIYNLTR
jgi:hypothetical protein